MHQGAQPPFRSASFFGGCSAPDPVCGVLLTRLGFFRLLVFCQSLACPLVGEMAASTRGTTRSLVGEAGPWPFVCPLGLAFSCFTFALDLCLGFDPSACCVLLALFCTTLANKPCDDAGPSNLRVIVGDGVRVSYTGERCVKSGMGIECSGIARSRGAMTPFCCARCML